jgi:hypothetical protein
MSASTLGRHAVPGSHQHPGLLRRGNRENEAVVVIRVLADEIDSARAPPLAWPPDDRTAQRRSPDARAQPMFTATARNSAALQNFLGGIPLSSVTARVRPLALARLGSGIRLAISSSESRQSTVGGLAERNVLLKFGTGLPIGPRIHGGQSTLSRYEFDPATHEPFLQAPPPTTREGTATQTGLLRADDGQMESPSAIRGKTTAREQQAVPHRPGPSDPATS